MHILNASTGKDFKIVPCCIIGFDRIDKTNKMLQSILFRACAGQFSDSSRMDIKSFLPGIRIRFGNVLVEL